MAGVVRGMEGAMKAMDLEKVSERERERKGNQKKKRKRANPNLPPVPLPGLLDSNSLSLTLIE